ncbi:unnamed protein product [Parascedosporium putredinis]|uniref:BPL/LPL catalytic domain-containing protein n=1 Tax=Parascedosporium putredinis TaxID=1442378 RepID=A0A9P1GZY9_9PEZI|nr:unnamed protein product [Parascedosporium putredinis]CAI7992285.1 unnamed protein product [Parascedosporium putredinis]
MSVSRLNVLVYTGPGTTVDSVRHCLYTLRRLLSPNYAVTPVSENALLKEPWLPTCALLVFPGGADLGFCSVLNGPGNRRITEYVRRGGRFLGFCAGGYYGSGRCEFEVGDPTSRSSAVASSSGARAAKISVRDGALGLEGEGTALGEISLYYNGGGVFVDAAAHADSVEVLANYVGDIDVDGGDGKAAVVYCKVGQELPFSPDLIPNSRQSIYRRSPRGRVKFLQACLSKLGLEVDETEAMMPSLSSLHLSALNPSEVDEMLHDWEDIIARDDRGEEFIKCENDTFHVEKKDSRWEPTASESAVAGGIVDYTTIVKRVVPHGEAWPDVKETPSFHHNVFYTSLQSYRDMEPAAEEWGNQIMYGEVVTSTNTVLEKEARDRLHSHRNDAGSRTRPRLQRLARAPGCLIMSTVINHPAHLAASRPIVFLQYLAAIATVEAVRSYGPGYNNLDLKIKWPNDVYARDPVITAIPPPTRCGRPSLQPFRIERLIARMLTLLESLYAEFRRDGFSAALEARYYGHWLHTGQKVTLEAEGGVRARVLGVTRDWGMLKAEELDGEGRTTGKVWTLQSDENSFDYWKGLLKRKT